MTQWFTNHDLLWPAIIVAMFFVALTPAIIASVSDSRRRKHAQDVAEIEDSLGEG